MKCLICGEDMFQSEHFVSGSGKEYSETCKKCQTGIFSYDREKYIEMKEKIINFTIIKSALKQLVSLHNSEMEGLSSGKPTFNQWIDAVLYAEEALR